jgi:uncharacterized membrane protein YphA (DoxX/SURF4 family)
VLSSLGTIVPLFLIEGVHGFKLSCALLLLLGLLLTLITGFFAYMFVGYRKLIPINWELSPEDNDEILLQDTEKRI